MAGFLNDVRASISNPYPVYEAYRNLMAERCLPGTDGRFTVFLLDHEDVATVLRSAAFGRRADPSGAQSAQRIVPSDCPRLSSAVENWVVFMDPPRHPEVRRWMNVALDEVLASATVSVDVGATVREVFDSLTLGVSLDFVTDFAERVPKDVLMQVLGIPKTDRAEVLGYVRDIQNASTLRPGPRKVRLAVAERGVTQLAAYFGELGKAAALPPGSLLARLLAHRDQKVDDDLLVATCIHVLSSGQEALSMALVKQALLVHRGAVDGLPHPKAPEEWDAWVDEILRVDSPTQMLSRWAYEETTVAGFRLHPGDRALCVVGAANRDPQRYDRPTEFDPVRRPRGNMSFGLGAHYCFGSVIARACLRSALEALLACRSIDFAPVDADDFEGDLVFHGPRHAIVRLAGESIVRGEDEGMFREEAHHSGS